MSQPVVAEPVVLILGDSLSAAYGMPGDQGWVALLERRLRQSGYPHRVVNASISGETTAGGLSRLPRALSRFQPAIVVIELGANDGLRGLAHTQTRDNLDRIITLARDSGAQPLLLGMMLPPNFGRTFNEKFLALYTELATEREIPLVPFFLTGVADRAEWMQGDGLHPNAGGQPRMLENVWPYLEPLLRASTPDRLSAGK